MAKIEDLKSLKSESVDYMCDEIKHVITNFGKRDPGSQGERDAQHYMKDVLAEFTDTQILEDFQVNPGSFFGWIPITICFVLASIVLFFFSPILALIFIVLGLVPMVTQFLMYRKTFDPLFEKRTSCNVTAIRKPTGEVKRRILFNGHADATWEWTINYKWGGKAFTASLATTFISIALLAIFSIINIIVNGGNGFFSMPDMSSWVTYLGFIMVLFIPLYILMFFFSNKKVVVDGANDNLTGCYMPIALVRALDKAGIELENTEVGVILSGSEEAGLRGAKAWAAAHKGEFKDVPTFIVAYDTLYEPKCLDINDKDLNGFCITDRDVCSLLKTASQNVGAGARFNTVTVGATDPAAFVQGGFKSTCITALDHSLQPYYHTRRDTYDLLNKDCLGTVYDMSVEALKLFDEGNYDGCSVDVVRAKGIRKEFPRGDK